MGALLTAYVRAQGKAAGARNEFCGPMAKQHRMAVLTIAALYAGLLPRSWQPLLGGLATIDLALLIIVLGAAVTTIRRLLRIAQTLRESPA
jgi:phosphatidylglycerophosphate synthase